MVISMVLRLWSVRGIESKENGLGKFKEKFGGELFLWFFCIFQRIGVVVINAI